MATVYLVTSGCYDAWQVEPYSTEGSFPDFGLEDWGIEERRFYGHIVARDAQHALKIASERRVAILANEDLTGRNE